MTSTNDERKAAEQAKTALSSLTPTTPRTDATVVALRMAADRATKAISGFPSEAALDAVRGEASAALYEASHSLHRGELTRDIIDRARRIADAWLDGLATTNA
jgi:hypothetical protein